MIKKILRALRRPFIRTKIKPVYIPLLEGRMLENRCALIIGGSGGIGQGIAKMFVKHGCKVVISGTSKEKLERICAGLGTGAKYLVTDLTNISSLENIAVKAADLLGEGAHIDILINAAGVHNATEFWEITEKDWDLIMDINLKATYFLCRSVAGYMIDNKISGHILNIGSASELKPGKTPYEISKAGIKSLTVGLASEFIKHGIFVNCLSPGPTATPMINHSGQSLEWQGNPTGRVALPEEIAGWAVVMVSDLGKYVVGSSVYVTGGSGTVCIDK